MSQRGFVFTVVAIACALFWGAAIRAGVHKAQAIVQAVTQPGGAHFAIVGRGEAVAP